METVQEIGQSIMWDYPHALYELTPGDFIDLMRRIAQEFQADLTDTQVLAIADWCGFEVLGDEEILELWHMG